MMLTTTLLTTLALTAPASAEQDSPDYERRIERTFAMGDIEGTEVTHSMGSLLVRGWDRPEIKVEARIVVDGEQAKAFGEAIDVTFDVGSTLEIETVIPKRVPNDRRQLSFAVELEVHVPAGLEHELTNSFGSVTLENVLGNVETTCNNGAIVASGIRGESELASSFGSISVQDAKGNAKLSATHGAVTVNRIEAAKLEIEASFGSVEVASASGNVDIESTNGAITVRDIGGSVTTEGAYGSQQFERIGGSVDVEGTNAPVQVMGAGAGVTIENAFGSVKVHEIGGDLDVENGNGPVEGVGIRGSARIEASYAKVSLTRVDGSADVEVASGPAELEDIGASVTVSTSYGSISVNGYGGDARLEADSGHVRLAGQRGDVGRIHCRSKFGSIDVSLPGPPSFELRASVTFGKITSDFELPGIERRSNREEVECRLGAGETKLDLESSSGNVHIRREERSKGSTN